MTLSIPVEIIKEIAGYLESGMKCFYHIPSGELEYYPDDSNGYGSFTEEIWEETIDKIEGRYQEYIPFEGIESHESFRIMGEFTASIEKAEIRHRFEDAISYRKPFQNFKQLLYNYPELRQQWFDYKNQHYIEWVQNQLAAYNSSLDKVSH